MLASTVTELTTADGAVNANSVPAVIAASRSVGDGRSGKRKRTPRRRKQRGRDHRDNDDSSDSSNASSALVLVQS